MGGPKKHYAKLNISIRQRKTNAVWFYLHVVATKWNKWTNKAKTDSDLEKKIVVAKGWVVGDWAK